MTLSREKVDIILARKRVTITEFCEAVGISRNRFYVALNSKKISPKVAGRFANELGVDVTEIIED